MPGDNDDRTAYRTEVPIVVVLFHREEETRQMFEQLEKVTDGYSLVLVNNGFDDADLISELNPAHYIENEVNVGAIKAINQGLEVVDSDYIGVLHSDLLIYDEGWLDHIIAFMDRRDDVGLVGLAGRHAIRSDGSYVVETTVVNMRGYPTCYVPTWRFTEVATVDGLGWVMRNDGKRLEEGYGFMHYYDLDLSLQFIESGYKVYVAAIDIWHMAEDIEKSTRSMDEYLLSIGGDDDELYEQMRAKFSSKWGHLLPIWRGYRDEAVMDEIVRDSIEVRKALEDGKAYAVKLEEELRVKAKELEKLKEELRLARSHSADEDKT